MSVDYSTAYIYMATIATSRLADLCFGPNESNKIMKCLIIINNPIINTTLLILIVFFFNSDKLY